MEESETDHKNLFETKRFTQGIISITIELSNGAKVTLTREEFLKRLVETLEQSVKDHLVRKFLRKGLGMESGE